MIPFLDLKLINRKYEPQFTEVYNQFLDSGRYILGDAVKTFEQQFSNFCGTDYAIGTGNGLDALILIFKGLIERGKLNPGDEVLVPANTYIASILSVIHAGLKPVFVEPDINTYNLDPRLLNNHLSRKSKAILVVHLYGQLADMDPIIEFSNQHDLIIVEDAAQAHGARDTTGRMAGNFGEAAGFSFYPTKNLGALGDGGAITTSDRELHEVLYKMRDYGRSSKYLNDLKGINSRLDELQAGWLSIKLKDLDDQNKARREMADYYLINIHNPKLKLPVFSGGEDHVFHQFVLRVGDRQNFVNYMTDKGIGTLIHYPVPPYRQKALGEYSTLNLPITDTIHGEVVSIPLNPSLKPENLEYIVEQLNRY